MTYYVSNWDYKSPGLNGFNDATHLHTIKSGLHPHHHQHSLQKKSSSALVPNHHVPGSLTQMAIQEEVNSQITFEVVRNSVLALDTPVAASRHEDEMLLWLQYPLQDSFDQNYCSELSVELGNPQMQLVKDAFVHQTPRDVESTNYTGTESIGCEQARPQPPVNPVSMQCARSGVNSDTAMAMGAGRAAGLISQAGSEAFVGVRSHVFSSSSLKPSSSSSFAEPFLEGKKSFETYNSGLVDGKTASSTITTLSSGLNFSAFSRPVATTLDSLRTVCAVSGPTNAERVRQPLTDNSSLLCESSTGVMIVHPSSQHSTGYSSQLQMAREGDGFTVGGWSSPTDPPCGQEAHPCRPDVRSLNEIGVLNSHANCPSGIAISTSEHMLRMAETAETTMSHFQLSGSSVEEIAEEAFTSISKKKLSAKFVEEVENEAAHARKPPPGQRAIKKSRVAEIHNESEKKRRNKINVKLKALQSLIPNSNKTDKASVLDEAIEYTKMLQAQLQFMSMRTGVFVPQMMMPSAMHYVPMHQMPLSHLGMGLGFNVGSDMGIKMRPSDTNAATAGLDVSVCVAGAGAGAGAVFNSLPTSNVSPAGQMRVGIIQQPTSIPVVRDVSICPPASCGSEPYRMMLAQQPVQRNQGMPAKL